MLVTNMGQVIRIRVHGGEGDSIRIASRKTQGVRLFDVADDNNEKVVSAGLVRDTDEDEEATSAEGGPSNSADDIYAPTVSDIVTDDIASETPGLVDPNEDTPT